MRLCSLKEKKRGGERKGQNGSEEGMGVEESRREGRACTGLDMAQQSRVVSSCS